jgi:hypothetical protein
MGWMSRATFVDTPRAHKKGAIADLHVLIYGHGVFISSDAGTLVLSETAGLISLDGRASVTTAVSDRGQGSGVPDDKIRTSTLHAYQIWLACADSDDPFLCIH